MYMYVPIDSTCAICEPLSGNLKLTTLVKDLIMGVALKANECTISSEEIRLIYFRISKVRVTCTNQIAGLHGIAHQVMCLNPPVPLSGNLKLTMLVKDLIMGVVLKANECVIS